MHVRVREGQRETMCACESERGAQRENVCMRE